MIDYKKAASEAAQRIRQAESEQLKREREEDRFNDMVRRVVRECGEAFNRAIEEETGCIGFSPNAEFKRGCCTSYEVSMPCGYRTRAAGMKTDFSVRQRTAFTWATIPEDGMCRCDPRIHYPTVPVKFSHHNYNTINEEAFRQAFENWTYAKWFDYWIKAASKREVQDYFRPLTREQKESRDREWDAIAEQNRRDNERRAARAEHRHNAPSSAIAVSPMRPKPYDGWDQPYHYTPQDLDRLYGEDK